MGRTGWRCLALVTVVLAVATAVTWPVPAVAATDWDSDGFTDTDCRPLDPAVNPSATDHPDLAFEDLNCDGIDGDSDAAYFVQASGGSDGNLGTAESPFATIQRAITAARAGFIKSIYVSTGSFNGPLDLPSDADGVRIYGGYQPGTWARTTGTATTISGQPQTALLNGATDVVFQLLTFNGTRGLQTTAYGIRAIGGSELVLIRSTASAGPGAPGGVGSTGTQPGKAQAGAAGDVQSVPSGMGGSACDYAGTSVDVLQPGNGTDGGAGGAGGEETNDGEAGQPGIKGDGLLGGSLGAGGTDVSGTDDNPADTENGKNGGQGGTGSAGSNGTGGPGDFTLAGATWAGRAGTAGTAGGTGYGGGGGGGGAGDGAPWGWSAGAGGGQGGDGGAGGGPGGGGSPGGGSFGVYLHDSQLAVADASTVQAGAGGVGGDGGSGGPGGLGGDGGPGATAFDCPTKDGGNGGDGGPGGPGGAGGNGGGGAGGPSVGIMRIGTSLATVRSDSSAVAGTGGNGGVGPGAAGEGGNGQSGEVLPAGSPATDFDSDGITDTSDACVDVAAPGTANGCPARPAALPDTDGDGIPNSADSCASTPAGSNDANGDGCPDPPPDTDGDGVIDADDGCDSTPAGSVDADHDGCPDQTGGGTDGGGGADTGGGTTANPPLGATPDITAPNMTWVVRAQRALRTKALVWAGRSDEACSLAVTALLKAKKLGSLKKSLAAGVSTKLRIRLARKARGILRRALATRRKVTVALRTACVDAAGNKRSASPKLVVKR